MRLVDAEALLKNVEKLLISYRTVIAKTILDAIRVLIDNMPTIEAKPVVHAHWLMTEYEYFDCSNCGVAIWNGCDSTG